MQVWLRGTEFRQLSRGEAGDDADLVHGPGAVAKLQHLPPRDGNWRHIQIGGVRLRLLVDRFLQFCFLKNMNYDIFVERWYLVNPADDSVHAKELHEPVNVELQLLSHLESDTEVFDGRSMAHLCKAIEVM